MVIAALAGLAHGALAYLLVVTLDYGYVGAGCARSISALLVEHAASTALWLSFAAAASETESRRCWPCWSRRTPRDSAPNSGAGLFGIPEPPHTHTHARERRVDERRSTRARLRRNNCPIRGENPTQALRDF